MTRAIIRLILCAVFNGSIPQDYGFRQHSNSQEKQQNNISTSASWSFFASEKTQNKPKGKKGKNRSRVKFINRNILRLNCVT